MKDIAFTPMLSADHALAEQNRISNPMDQREYLCIGKIKTWTGPRLDVLSPICDTHNGCVQRNRIGSYPLLTEQLAIKTLSRDDRAGRLTQTSAWCEDRRGQQQST